MTTTHWREERLWPASGGLSIPRPTGKAAATTCACVVLAFSVSVISLGASEKSAPNLPVDNAREQALDYLLEGKYERALELFSREIARNPANAENYKGRANALRELHQYTRALADLETASRLAPGDAFVEIDRGFVYTAMKRQKDAIDSYTRAIALDPRQWFALSCRAEMYAKTGDVNRALHDYGTVIALRPKNGESMAHMRRGKLLFKNARYREAISDFDAALRQDPKATSAYVIRGDSYAALGQNEEALRDYSEAVRVAPHFAWVYRWRAGHYQRTHELQRALDDLTKAIELEPSAPEGYLDRGRVQLALRSLNDAVSDISVAIRLDPKNPAAYCSRGSALTAKRQYDKAIADYTEAIRLDPKLGAAYYGRGQAYEKKREDAKAKADFAEAKRLGFEPKPKGDMTL